MARLGFRAGLVSVVAVGAVVATAVPASAADADESAAGSALGQSFGDWDVDSLQPITPVEASPSRVNPPVYSDSTVTGSQGLSVSMQPVLKLDKPVTAEFDVQQIGAPAEQVLWHASSGNDGQVRVSAGVLKSGEAYTWSATALGTGQKFGPYVMKVDTDRSQVAPPQSFGPLSVQLATGAVQLGMSTRKVQGGSGDVGATLSWEGGQPTSPGLPGGWLISGQNQPYRYVQTLPSGAASLVAIDGTTTNYQAGADGSLIALLASGRIEAPGQNPILVRNPDGSFTATATNGQVTTFEPPDGQGHALFKSSYNGTKAVPTLESSNGRLDKIADSINPDMSVKVLYQGSDNCPDVAMPDGFVSVPDGGLCGFEYPDGSHSAVQYIADPQYPGAVLLARLVDYPQTKDSKPRVTDIGWDSAGRVVSVREANAAWALASGARTDTDAVVTSVGYDPLGRVAQIAKPAAKQGQPRSVSAFEYSSGVTTQHPMQLTADGKLEPVQTPAGFLSKDSFDPQTLLPLSTTDASGHVTGQTWNTSADQKLTDSDQLGRVRTYTYDTAGGLVAVAGPFVPRQRPVQNGKVPVAPAGAVSESYAYDQDVSDTQPRDLHGFAVTYWANDALSESPAGRVFGPQFDDRVPSAVQWTWLSSPVNSGSWSARLTGLLTIPGKPAKPQVYRFQAGLHTKLWINDVACQPDASGSCSFPLTPGQEYQIRIDYTHADSGSDSGGSLDVRWAPPGTLNPQPLPMTQIRPGYGLQSVTTKRDQLAAGTSSQPRVMAAFDDPASGNPTSTWTPGIEGNPSKTSYETFDPANQQYGRLTSTDLPAGNTTSFSYYTSTDAPSDIGCESGEVNQLGLPKSFTRGDQTYESFHDVMGREVGSRTVGTDGPHATTCTTYDDAGEVTEVRVPARGDQPSETTTVTYFEKNDPFTTKTTTTVGDATYTTYTHIDLYGKTLGKTDIYGTTYTYTYDPLTGKQLTATTTLADGKGSTTVTNTYASSGELTSIAADGVVLATLAPVQTDGSQTITYFNGVSTTITPQELGGLDDQTWRTADRKQLSYTTEKANSQRVLAEQITYDTGKTAKYDYVYDLIGRLTSARLSAPIQTTASQWEYGFGTPALGSNDKAGLNSNRTSAITISNAGTSKVDYGYNSNDQLIATSDPAVNVTADSYSDIGEINQVGALTIDYTADSKTSKITDHGSGTVIDFGYVDNQLVSKTVSDASGRTTTQYRGGFLTDEQGNPSWHVMSLPGGVTLIRTPPSGGSGVATDHPSAQQLTQAGLAQAELDHNTPRGQLMWTSDATGKIGKTGYLYDPYGQLVSTPVSQPTAGGAADAVPLPDYQWQAADHNESITLSGVTVILDKQRLYIPALGRFTSPDPINQGSVNAYDYSNQDPVNQSDTTGSIPGWADTLLEVAVPLVAMAVCAVAVPGIGQAAAMTAFEASGSADTGMLAGSIAGALFTGSVTAGSQVSVDLGLDGRISKTQIGAIVASTAVSMLLAGAAPYANAARKAAMATRELAESRAAFAASAAERGAARPLEGESAAQDFGATGNADAARWAAYRQVSRRGPEMSIGQRRLLQSSRAAAEAQFRVDPLHIP